LDGESEMSALAPNPQTETGIGGAGPPPISGDDFSQYYLPQNMVGLPSSPPAGAYTDSTYLANEAAIRNDISTRYATALKALGYTDPATGQFIPGDLINAANLSEQQSEQGMQQADLANTQAMQQAGTLFSGMRGQQQALAETPFLQQIGQTELQLPQDLASQYQTAAGLIGEYNTRNNQELAAAAQRATAAIDQTPTGSSVTPPPPAPASTPPPAPAYNPNAYVHGGSTPAQAQAIQAAGYQPFAQGGEVDQPTAAIIGEAGPETVVPHANLTADEQGQLANLAATARARASGVSAGIPPPPYGPPGATDPNDPRWLLPHSQPLQLLPPASGGIHTLPAQMHPAAALQALGQHQAAVNMYLQHHPGALAGRATGIPHWAQAAVAARLHAMRNPIHTLPVYEGPLGGGAYA
jgi:hypothetical protein